MLSADSYRGLTAQLGIDERKSSILGKGFESVVLGTEDRAVKVFVSHHLISPATALASMEREARSLVLFGADDRLQGLIPQLHEAKTFQSHLPVEIEPRNGSKEHVVCVGALYMSRLPGKTAFNDDGPPTNRTLSEICNQMASALCLLHQASTSKHLVRQANGFPQMHAEHSAFGPEKFTSRYLSKEEAGIVVNIDDEHAQQADKIYHGDLHFRNILLDRQGKLSGIIDFGQASKGSPAIDFLHLSRPDILMHIGRQYHAAGLTLPTSREILQQQIIRDAQQLLKWEKASHTKGSMAIPGGIQEYVLAPLKKKITLYTQN